ncbi:MAG: ComF family protein [Flavobacteriales bacterium]|jgi:ComF family protein
MRRIARITRQLLAQMGLNFCALCKTPCTNILCLDCHTGLNPLGLSCYRCALPLEVEDSLCAECVQHPPDYERSTCAYALNSENSKLIHAFKDQAALHFGQILSEGLIKTIENQYSYTRDTLPELLCPVPSHWRKHLLRGFNQADYISQELGKHFNIPTQSLIRKTSHQPAQKDLSRQARIKAMSHSFETKNTEQIQGHIAIVDDVVTTGSTARAVASTLCNHGATRVDIWALARTPKPR